MTTPNPEYPSTAGPLEDKGSLRLEDEYADLASEPSLRRSAEDERRSEMDDICSQLYGFGVPLAPGEEFYGVTPEYYDSWLAGLTPEARQQLDEQTEVYSRNERAITAAAEQIKTTTPELLQGKLPEAQASLLPGRYLLGSNQSGAFEAQDAQDYLAECRGVDFTNYNLTNRFLFFDASKEPEAESNRQRAVATGYYGPGGGGKFIIAVPISDAVQTDYSGMLPGSVADEMRIRQELPTDYTVEYGQAHESVSAKYCAGFIDTHGIYHPNANFMISAEPAVVDPTSEIM